MSISCKYSSIKRYDNTDYEPKIVAEVRDTFKVDNIMDAGPLAVVSKEIVNGKLNIYFTNKNMITEFQNKGRELISTKAKDSQHETQLFHSYYVKENGIAFVVTTSATCYFSELD
nr:hypothetical protein BHI3_12260 [Bacteriovorax sp. HI3]